MPCFSFEESAMNRRWCSARTLSVLMLTAFSTSFGADEPASEKAAAPVVEPADDTQAEVARHIKTLAEGDLLQRLETTSKLLKMGQAAVAPLAKEAGEGRKETMYHCFDVLTRLLASNNAETSAATKVELTKLTQSPNRPVALRANSALQLGEILGARAARRPAPARIPAGPNVVPNVQLNVALNGANAVKVQTTVINDERVVQVERGDERIEIRDKSGKDIVVRQTRTVDGKLKTDEFKAADSDELKKNHPEAFKLYEQYAPRNVNVQIRGGKLGGAIQIQVGPGQFGVANGARRMPAEPGSTPSGARLIRAEDAEGELEISDENGRNIRVRLTKKIDGKEVVEEHKADDLKQLSAEHPAAAKLYEKYTGSKAP